MKTLISLCVVLAASMAFAVSKEDQDKGKPVDDSGNAPNTGYDAPKGPKANAQTFGPCANQAALYFQDKGENVVQAYSLGQSDETSSGDMVWVTVMVGEGSYKAYQVELPWATQNVDCSGVNEKTIMNYKSSGPVDLFAYAPEAPLDPSETVGQ